MIDVTIHTLMGPFWRWTTRWAAMLTLSSVKKEVRFVVR